MKSIIDTMWSSIVRSNKVVTLYLSMMLGIVGTCGYANDIHVTKDVNRAVLCDWYEALSDDAGISCARWDDFWMGANVAIPVTGLSTPISASDVIVTAVTYSELGTPVVLSESEMWNEYGAPVKEQVDLGNVIYEEEDSVWANWETEHIFAYELSDEIWPDWAQVSDRQWILIPTGVPRLGTHTFSVKINGVEHDEYVVSFVMAEDQEAVPLKEFKVEFDACGGSVSEAERIVVERTALGALPTPMLEGYTFDGWWTAENGGEKITPETLVVEPITYYAHWTHNTYSVAFDANGGEGGEIVSFLHGSKLGALPTPMREGYTFDGWWTAESGGERITPETLVVEPITYYAHWTHNTYSVVFDANGGEDGEIVLFLHGSNLGVLPTPMREGYTFDGWWTAENGGEKITPETLVVEPITYYAHWLKQGVLGDWYEALSDDYGISCARWDDFWMGANVAIPVAGLSTPISASDVIVTAGTYSEFGTPVVLSESEMWNEYGAPIKEQVDLGNVIYEEEDSVWANWETEHIFAYELSDEIWPDWAQVSDRQWILIPTGVPRLGTHTFSVKINGVEHDEYVVSFVMAEDQEAVPLKEFKVEFDACGGSVSEAERIVVERTALGALPTPTREGYVFDGWWTAEKDGIQVTPDTLVVEPITYYAHWVSIFSFESVSGDTIKITGFRDPAQIISTLIIPNTIEDKAVVSIGDGAFANSQCGMEKLILSMFCTNISDKAFNGVASLSEVVFVETRKWDDPSQEAILSIGRYAFAGTGMVELELPKTVGNVGDYAFANCKAMSSITILGAPAVGSVPFRRCGMDVGGVTVHLDPALANDSVYMDKLSQQCWGNVTVRADAIVTRMTLSSLAMSASEIELSVSVEKAASWGKVDTSLVKVAYRESLSKKPIMLDPSSVTENADGSLTVKVVAPKGNSGFFQVVLEK